MIEVFVLLFENVVPPTGNDERLISPLQPNLQQTFIQEYRAAYSRLDKPASKEDIQNGLIMQKILESHTDSPRV